VGEHLCDQLMLPLALSATQGETSSFVTGPLSAHSLTHIELISKFLDVMIKVQELTGDRQRVSIQRG